MRVVLDCNVLIAAGITNGVCRQVVDAVVREHEWYVPEPLIREFQAVSQRPRLRAYRSRLQAIEQVLSAVGLQVVPDSRPIALPDPDDVVYLQTAVAAKATALVTGNQRHFPFPVYRGVHVYSPREFLNRVHTAPP